MFQNHGEGLKPIKILFFYCRILCLYYSQEGQNQPARAGKWQCSFSTENKFQEGNNFLSWFLKQRDLKKTSVLQDNSEQKPTHDEQVLCFIYALYTFKNNSFLIENSLRRFGYSTDFFWSCKGSSSARILSAPCTIWQMCFLLWKISNQILSWENYGIIGLQDRNSY